MNVQTTLFSNILPFFSLILHADYDYEVIRLILNNRSNNISIIEKIDSQTEKIETASIIRLCSKAAINA